jgi:transcription-repair coupling factor (superfamily II helicase)
VKQTSSLRSIQKLLADAPSFIRLAERWDAGDARIYLKNAVGSLSALATAFLFERAPSHIVLVAPDDERAEALRADMETLLGEERVLWYAESDKKLALDAEHLDTQLVGVTGALAEFVAREKNVCIVAPAHALAFPVPEPASLRGHLMEIRTGDTVKFDEFITRLTTSGFNRKDFVETHGDVAVRGGIVDIFSPGMENPARLEFFGDDIDSIREFDPLSQRSIKELQGVSIITHLFHNDEHSVHATLLDYLPPDSLFVEVFPEQIASALAKSEAAEANGDDNNDNAEQLPDIIARYRRFRSLCVNSIESREADITLKATAHPICNSSVAALVREMRRLAALQYVVVCAADGQEQMKRLRDLIESALESDVGADAAADASHDVSSRNAPDEDRLQPLASVEVMNERVALATVSLSEGFICSEARAALLTEHQIFMRRRAVAALRNARARGKKSDRAGISLKELQQLRRGDYIVHSDKGVAQFDGLETITVGGAQQESVRLIFAGGDKMYVHLNYLNRLQKYSAQDGAKPSLTKLGTGEWQRKKDRAKKRLKDMARELIALYARRKSQAGFAFPADSLWQKELEVSFMYEDTPDQASATRAVKDDMESPTPMDRLVCGDVGFGKTEVAIRAAFKAVQAGKQVALLAPTTILAEQHLSSFRDRLERYAVSCAALSRFRSVAEQKDILKRVESGAIDILIGTHRILSKDVKFKDLGLLVIDEEHRFGVAAKEKLRQLRVSVDTLTLTATPIPRTLNFSLMGARDVSVINTPPRNRLPVKTEITVWNDAKLTAALERELARGGQVFFVSDRIGDLDILSERLRELVPSLRIAVAHGQMSPDELEKQMERFLERKVDALLATKIIESGIDIPNANTIIIHNADNFGLAELYQLRGRVGRSNAQAYCYLLIPPPQTLTRTALRRLQAMEEFSDLGSGFKLAMRDLEIRGAGNLLGAEQSGFIADIGFELYQKILDEAVLELKETEFSELFAHERRARGRKQVITESGEALYDIELPAYDDMTVETADGDAMLPKSYVQSEVERYELYKKLFRAAARDEVESIVSEMRDRFGALPDEALRLIEAVYLRIAALPTGFGHVSLKKGELICEFPPEEHVAFYENAFPAMMNAVAQMPETRIVSKGKKIMLHSSVGSLENAIALLGRIVEATKQEILHHSPLATAEEETPP